MSSEEEKPKFSVFEDVKNVMIAPEALMAEINSAISALEYARAVTFIQSPQPHVSKPMALTKKLTSQYDALMAEETPQKTSAAFTRIRSFVSLTSQQLQRS